MNKSLVYFLIFFAFISCKAEEEKIFLNVEKSYVSFTSASGTERIPVNTNSAFNASSPADWCSVKTSENQLSISVEENKNSQERTAKIVVGAEKVQDFLIEVHQ